MALLPKCPLCLAAWLTVATGIGISAAAVVWSRELVVGLWIVLLARMVGQAFSLRTRFQRVQPAESRPRAGLPAPQRGE